METTSYSLLYIGDLYQLGVDVMTAACKRFGAEKAELIIERAKWESERSNSIDKIIENTYYETKFKLNSDDIDFLKKIFRAEAIIRQAKKVLKEACDG